MPNGYSEMKIFAKIRENMRLTFKVSKLVNLFFFVANLSEWHRSCRPAYNQKWLAATGSLSPKEQSALEKFRTVIKKYGFRCKNNASLYIGRFFFQYPKEKIREQLRTVTTAKEYWELMSVLHLFRPRFEKIWRLWRRPKSVALLRQFFNQRKGRAILEDLMVIFGIPKSCADLVVIVLWSPLGHTDTAAGGANIDAPYVSLEVPDLRPRTWQFAYSIGVLAHEIGHLLLSGSGGELKIKNACRMVRLPPKAAGIPMNTLEFLTESIVESFVPLGAIGLGRFPRFLTPIVRASASRGRAEVALFKKGMAVKNPRRLISYFVEKLRPLATRYLTRKRRIDYPYIHAAAKTLAVLASKRTR